MVSAQLQPRASEARRKTHRAVRRRQTAVEAAREVVELEDHDDASGRRARVSVEQGPQRAHEETHLGTERSISMMSASSPLRGGGGRSATGVSSCASQGSAKERRSHALSLDHRLAHVLELKLGRLAHVEHRPGLLLHQRRPAVGVELVDVEAVVGAETDAAGEGA